MISGRFFNRTSSRAAKRRGDPGFITQTPLDCFALLAKTTWGNPPSTPLGRED